MTQPSPPSSLEQEEQSSSNPRGSRSSRVSRSLSAMGFFQQSEDSSESTLSSSGRRDSASKDQLDPAAYGESTELPARDRSTFWIGENQESRPPGAQRSTRSGS